MSNKRENKFASDKHRPVYHFLPPQNWMNDPNGLIYWKGKYHLFYQYNPYDAVWGNMTWGHAMSDDLIHWQYMPYALERIPDSYDANGVFSGCAVDNNGVPTILYTGTTGIKNEIQTLCIATSQDDDLRTWQKYENNPVIAAPPSGFKELNSFRDPYVWRDGDTWYMVIGAGRTIGSEAVLLYRSSDLYQWEYLHPLYESDAKNDYIYECPNFFPLGDKWVLIVSVMPMDRVEYFIGTFENLQFTVEHKGLLVDGAFFAPLTFHDGNCRIMFGWITETRPSGEHQAAGWAGAMTLPLEVQLSQTGDELRLVPIDDRLLEDAETYHFENVTETDLTKIQAAMDSLALYVEVESVDVHIWIDHSVVEVSKDNKYYVCRIYDDMGLWCLSDFVEFPIKRLRISKINSIWE